MMAVSDHPVFGNSVTSEVILRVEYVSSAPLYAQTIIGCLILLGNSLVLTILKKGTTFSKITKLLLSSLAVGDLLFGGIFLTRGLVLLVSPPTEHLCRFFLAIVTVGMMTSFGTTAIMSVHYYVVVNHPKSAKADGHWRVYLAAEVIKWSSSVFVGVLFFAFRIRPQQIECLAVDGYTNRTYFGVICLVIIFLIVIAAILQVLSGLGLRKRFNRVGLQEVDLTTSPTTVPSIALQTLAVPEAVPGTSKQQHRPSTSGRIRFIDVSPSQAPARGVAHVQTARRKCEAKDRRVRHAVVILALVSTAMLFCWVPVLVTSAAFSFYPPMLETLPVSLTPVTMSIAMLNSLFNIVIYIWKDKSFRKRLIQLFKRQ